MEAISCLMVTRGEFSMWRRGLKGFLQQRYGQKELVVVVDRDEERYQAIVADLVAYPGHNIRVYLKEAPTTLGELRTEAIRRAEGDVVCNWDDDDLYHPDRLQAQLDAMKEANCGASYLEEHLLYFEECGDLYWCDWWRTKDGGMPSTLMAFRRDLPDYPAISRHEDTFYQRALQRNGMGVANLRGLGGLHVYTCHSNNISIPGHHRSLGRFAGLEYCTLLARVAEVQHWIAAYPELQKVTLRSNRDECVFSMPAPVVAPGITARVAVATI